MTDPLPPSSLSGPLFSSAQMRAALDDRARLQRMLDFEAALARAEAAVGIVQASHAVTIAEACKADIYDLRALAEAAVPAGNLAIPVVDALRAEVGKRSKSAAASVHWGATSQDLIDTAMVLELRAVIDTLFTDLDRTTKAFTALAGRHRRNMTVARTQLQQALPMPFGLKVAGYGAALARSRDRLRRLRKDALVLQFGGAAGTLAVLGEKGLDVSERLAALLDLSLPDAPWHSHRDRLAEVAAAFAILAGTCGKIARDVALLMQSEVAEVFEPSDGDGSPALPHQRNPVRAAAALAAATSAPNLAATILNAQVHEHERAVGGWQAEWVTFPALALAVSGALSTVADIAEGLTVDVDRMKTNLEASGGLALAEAVSSALAEKIGKAEAQDLVAELIRQSASDSRPFREVAVQDSRVTAQINAVELERLFRPNHYQGTSQTFIDRLVASSQGRSVRRTVSHLIEPKMPAARPDHLAAIKAAASAVKATADPVPAPAAAEPAPPSAAAPVQPPAPAEVKPVPVVEAPTPVVAAAQDAAPAREPATQPPSEPDEEPGALLEVFAKIEAFAKAAENANAETGPADDERKPA